MHEHAAEERGRGGARRAVTLSLWIAVLPAGWLAWQRTAPRSDVAAIVADYRAALAQDSATGERAFEDVTTESGVLSIHDWDARGECRLPEPLGPGVGLADLDGDGLLDIFVAAGGALPPAAPTGRCQLWVRDGERFRDVAAEVGADVPGPAYGVACADYDGDGDVDVFVTRLGADVLLRNDGGRFTQVQDEAGVADGSFGASAAFFDHDRDGDLDLYVTNYIDWAPEREHECRIQGRRDYCGPTTYDMPAQDRLYENLGDGRFEDVTARAGILGHRGNGLGVVTLDFDADGFEDLYVANDVSPAFLWRNQGDGTFVDVALERGAAFNGQGIAISGMGVVSEDLDADGLPDLLVTNIADQSHLALLSRRGGYYDGSSRLGLTSWSIPATGFGVVLFDQDLDGALDLYVANGAIQLGPEQLEGRVPLAEDDQFARLVDGRFVNATAGSGAVTGAAGRGLARGDLDGDGDEDLVITASGGAVTLLRNVQQTGHYWLAIDVLGPAGSAAIGARVEIVTGERRQSRRVRAQESYLSSSAPRLHFGLGAAERVDEVLIVWPDGHERRLTDVSVDQVLEVARER